MKVPLLIENVGPDPYVTKVLKVLRFTYTNRCRVQKHTMKVLLLKENMVPDPYVTKVKKVLRFTYTNWCRVQKHTTKVLLLKKWFPKLYFSKSFHCELLCFLFYF